MAATWGKVPSLGYVGRGRGRPLVCVTERIRESGQSIDRNTPRLRKVELGMSENSGGNSGIELVAQDHGGALLSGGVPGNKGGGRPADKIREAARLGRLPSAD